MRMRQQAQRQDRRVDVQPGGETRGDDQCGNGARRKTAWWEFYSQPNLLSIHSTIRGGSDHRADHDLGAVIRLKEGQSLQVHSVNAGDDQRRKRYGAQHRQHLHHLVGAIGYARQVYVKRVVEQVAKRLYHIQQTQRVIVNVSKKWIELRLEDGAGFPLQRHAGIAEIDQHAAQLDQLALLVEEILQYRRRWIVENAVLQFVDAVIAVIDGDKVGVDNAVDDQIKKLGWFLFRPAFVARSESRARRRRDHGRVMRKSRPTNRYTLAKPMSPSCTDLNVLEDQEEIIVCSLGLEAFIVAAAILNVERMELKLPGQLVELRVIGIIKGVPGHETLLLDEEEHD